MRRGLQQLRWSDWIRCPSSSSGQEADRPCPLDAASPGGENAQLDKSRSKSSECPQSRPLSSWQKVITAHSRPFSSFDSYVGYLQADRPSLVVHSLNKSPFTHAQDELQLAVLGLASISLLHKQQAQPSYVRTRRRWLGLRPGTLVVAEQHSQHQNILHGESSLGSLQLAR